MKQKLEKKLTLKQERFIHEFIIYANATNAYQKVYNCTHSTADTNGARLLGNARIQAAIAEQNKKLLDKYQITEEEILQEFAAIAFQDIKNIFNDDGTLKQLKDLSPEARKTIAGIEVTSISGGSGEDDKQYGMLHKVKLNDKLKALDALARTMAMFKDRLAVGVDDDLANLILKARKRIK